MKIALTNLEVRLNQTNLTDRQIVGEYASPVVVLPGLIFRFVELDYLLVHVRITGPQQVLIDDGRKADGNARQIKVRLVEQLGVHDDRITIVAANVRAYVHNAEHHADAEQKEVNEVKDRVAKQKLQQEVLD